MSEPRTTAVIIEQKQANVPVIGVVPAAGLVPGDELVRTGAGLMRASAVAVGQVGAWASETAQQFGMLLAILMGPAVFSAYAFAAWALAANLGWTDTFVFNAGALSNWIIWLGVAVLVNTAAAILKKHTRIES